jgi:hypothetical protein
MDGHNPILSSFIDKPNTAFNEGDAERSNSNFSVHPEESLFARFSGESVKWYYTSFNIKFDQVTKLKYGK